MLVIQTYIQSKVLHSVASSIPHVGENTLDFFHYIIDYIIFLYDFRICWVAERIQREKWYGR